MAAATVTAAPTGRSSSMWASTASTISSEGARSLLSTSVTPTGNGYQYRQWAMEIPGVGNAKVVELPGGPGTVSYTHLGGQPGQRHRHGHGQDLHGGQR